MAISSTTRIVLASLGLVLSMYAVYVEHKVEHMDEEEEYSALCDIEAIGASCSAVFSLPEGRMLSYFGLVPNGHVLDVPNAVLGSIFYAQLLVLSKPIKPLVVGAMASSVFLAYQLTFVLGDLCLLCWSTHVINTTLFSKIILSPLLFGGGAKKKAA